MRYPCIRPTRVGIYQRDASKSVDIAFKELERTSKMKIKYEELTKKMVLASSTLETSKQPYWDLSNERGKATSKNS